MDKENAKWSRIRPWIKANKMTVVDNEQLKCGGWIKVQGS
jgi:hypothetical protein